ncbi:extracellular solute-binding protein [Paenibacillus doosanensis]|uniref:ABC transporter substrate-binding protein n=1 Tax=Paenibacillus doosanensis TaxID=1229154 RepID=UPI00217F9E1E|nr:extracellular solute-binding protein [Paenibacillus doosanensis]MCS7458552.1 extracellular solute-binding protein [Paenibacillus doosanensis]
MEKRNEYDGSSGSGYRKKGAASLAAIFLCLAVTACNGSAGDASEPAPAADKPSVQNSQEPVELVVYNASNSTATAEAFMDSDIGKEIKEKFPYVTIKFIATGKGTTPNELLVSGQDVDLILCSVFSFPVLADTGLLYDIGDLIKQNRYDTSRLVPNAIEFQKQFGGGVYGFPVASAPTALFYNKDIFDKFGVPYPKDGMTWDETYELAKQLTRTDAGTSYYGFATRYPFMYNTNQLSLSYYNPDSQSVQVSDDRFRLFMENFTRFAQIPGNEKATTDMFAKEKNVAMMAYQIGRWDFDSWDMVSMPTFKEAPGIGSQDYGTYMNISSTSKHKQQAFEVLEALTSDEYQMKISKAGTLPIVRTPEVVQAFGQLSDAASGRNFKGKNVGAFFPKERARPSYVTKYDDAIAKRMNTAFAQIVSGGTNPVSALREAQEGAEKDVSAMKK